jgi:hypothetical protein
MAKSLADVNWVKFFSFFSFFAAILITGAILLDQGIKSKEKAEDYAVTPIPGTILARLCNSNYCTYTVEYYIGDIKHTTDLKEFCATLPMQSKIGTTVPVYYFINQRHGNPVPLAMLGDSAPPSYTRTTGTVIAESLQPHKGCTYTVGFDFNGKRFIRNSEPTNSLLSFNINEKVNVLIYPAEVETGRIAIDAPNRTVGVFGGDPELREAALREQRDILELETHPEYERLMKKGKDMVIAGAVLTSVGGLLVLFMFFALYLLIIVK